MLDNIKIRKLENGYTVKYHIELSEDQREEGKPNGYSKEVYVLDRVKLGVLVDDLIHQHIQE